MNKTRIEEIEACLKYSAPFPHYTKYQEFIAHAPENITYLLDLIQKQQKVIEVMDEALEMGAFHHNSCPWLNGKECFCAHQKVELARAMAKEILG